MYSVRILPAAWDDLQDIYGWYSLSCDAETANKVIDNILGSVERLQAFPNSGTATPDKWLNERGYRMVIARPHAAIYRLIGNDVFVYHFMDMRRDYVSLFKRDL